MPTEEIGIAIANGSARILSSALAQQFQNQACLGCHAFVYLSIKRGIPCGAFSFPAIPQRWCVAGDHSTRHDDRRFWITFSRDSLKSLY
jgi:hypothetical protein